MSDELHAFLAKTKHTDARVIEHLVAFGEDGRADHLDMAEALLSEEAEMPDYWDVFGNVSHLTGRAIDDVLGGNHPAALSTIATLRERSGEKKAPAKKTAARKKVAPKTEVAPAADTSSQDTAKKTEAVTEKSSEAAKVQSESKTKTATKKAAPKDTEAAEVRAKVAENITLDFEPEMPSEPYDDGSQDGPADETQTSEVNEAAPAPGVPSDDEGGYVNTELFGDLNEIKSTFGSQG